MMNVHRMWECGVGGLRWKKRVVQCLNHAHHFSHHACHKVTSYHWSKYFLLSLWWKDSDTMCPYLILVTDHMTYESQGSICAMFIQWSDPRNSTPWNASSWTSNGCVGHRVGNSAYTDRKFKGNDWDTWGRRCLIFNDEFPYLFFCISDRRFTIIFLHFRLRVAVWIRNCLLIF